MLQSSSAWQDVDIKPLWVCRVGNGVSVLSSVGSSERSVGFGFLQEQELYRRLKMSLSTLLRSLDDPEWVLVDCKQNGAIREVLDSIFPGSFSWFLECTKLVSDKDIPPRSP